jgi:RimJ/RimL family protein N-acetyltransferase
MLDERKKRSIWGTLETNEASLRLAAKLGFRPVDELVVFERG